VKFRLPTEAEWEYACRAGTPETSDYGISKENLTDYAWYYENTFKEKKMSPQQIGRLLPNDWGLYDILGNIYEWCNDWFRRNYYNKSPMYNPPGPRYGKYKVVRGGDWARTDYFLRISSRRYYTPHHKDPFIGFRLAMSVKVKENA
jgi:formylglycine-generating enzyme required for sulfatase activity